MKKIILLLTSLLLSVATSYAQTVATGTTGACTWTLTGPSGNYTLTISGSGAMADYSSDQPWYSYRSSITQVIVENGVTNIGSAAFSDCSSLTSITIPNSVESIGSGAFYYCTSLTSVTIPNSVTSIGARAFFACSSLTAIVAENNTAYSSENGVLFNKTKTTLIQYPAGRSDISYVIPNSVESIGYGAFSRCTGLISVSIPNSVESIRDGAFSDCTGLTSVIIPNSVTSIDDESFFGCSSLTSVTIGNSVTSIGGQVFYGCTGLTSVTIPNSVTSIGYSAFHYCESLTSVTIPNSVESIGDWAFFSCTGLTSVTIGNSVESIGYCAFERCSSLTSVTNLNPTPQSITSDEFYDVDLSRATLYVPDESIEAYRAAFIWKDFGTIAAYVPSSIDAPAEENDLWVYPNPVRDSFRIRGLAAPALVVVTDLGGKIIWKQTLTGSESVPATHWPEGVYLLRAQGQTVKVVKRLFP